MSGYYVKDSEGNLIRTETATDENVKALLEEQYVNAVNYFKKDPAYINGSNKALMIFIGTVSLLVTVVFYLIIPLSNKDHRTISQS